MKDYSISEERANEIRAQINKKKEEGAKLNSFYQVDKIAEFSQLGIEIDTTNDIDFTGKSTQQIKHLFKDA